MAALILSVNPDLYSNEVGEILRISADKVNGSYSTSTSSGAWDTQMGHGRVNAYTALKYALSKVHRGKLYANITETANISRMTIASYNFEFAIPSGSYVNLKRYRMNHTINFPNSKNPHILGYATGYSGANPNSGELWHRSSNITNTSAEILSFVYEGYDVRGQKWYIPCLWNNYYFKYSILSLAEDNIYLQNQNAVSNQDIRALKNIKAGKNVINAISQGDYVVKSTANATLRALESIELQDGFSVEAGATFNADNKLPNE